VLGDWPRAAKFASAARRRVEHELSFDERTRRLEDVYDRLLRHPRASLSEVL